MSPRLHTNELKMNKYSPIFSLGFQQERQTKLRSKFGGMPWGFPAEQWPSDDLVLLAQIVHEPPMVDLGGDYVLHLWHWCDPDCFMDPPAYEGNRLFSTLLRRDELGDTLTPPPKETDLIGELFIDGWTENEDGFGSFETKFGGEPDWRGTGGAYGLPANAGAFLMQTDGSFQMEGSLGDFENSGTMLRYASGKVSGEKSKPNAPLAIEEYCGKLIVSFADFASDGIAFVFIDKSTSPPTPRWTWSR